MSTGTYANTSALASQLIMFGVFVSAGAIVCWDLRRRAEGITTRRRFGGPWTQLLIWNLWNLLSVAPLGVSEWIGRVGLPVSLALLVLSLLGKELQERAAAQPRLPADRAAPGR